jgi:hypothetical protein
MSGGVLLAALFWPIYSTLVEHLPRRLRARQLKTLAETVVGPAAMRLRIPRREIATLVAVLEGQYRFDEVKKKRAMRAAFARSPHFSALLDFVDLRVRAGELGEATQKEWHDLAADHPGRRHGELWVRSPRRRARR